MASHASNKKIAGNLRNTFPCIYALLRNDDWDKISKK